MTLPNLSIRKVAFQILLQLNDGSSFASEQLDAFLLNNNLEPRDRALLTQLVYGVLRENSFLESVLNPCLKKKVSPRWRVLLYLALYQMLCLDRIPDHAILHESVEIAKQLGGKLIGNFINGVLRKMQREAPAIKEQRQAILQLISGNSEDSGVSLEQIAKLTSLPKWLLQKWSHEYTLDKVKNWALNFQQSAPVYLRLNLKKDSYSSIINKLFESHLIVSELEKPLVLLEQGDVTQLKSFLEEGYVSIQDRGSYQIINILNPKAGEVGLDACAGHGGKTSAIAEYAINPISLYFYDIYSHKIKLLKENFSRLGLPSPIYFNPDSQQDVLFDWILMDAPCSGTGTLGRKPELRRRLKPEDFSRFSNQQLEILDFWSNFLKPGGRMLYSVCSLEIEENQWVIDSFLNKKNDFKVAKQGILAPGEWGADGFFFALLKKG